MEFASTCMEAALLTLCAGLLLKRQNYQRKKRFALPHETVHEILYQRYGIQSTAEAGASASTTFSPVTTTTINTSDGNKVLKEIKNLPSYDDLNYHIILQSGEEYVLKFNLSENNGDDLNLENVAMDALSNDESDPALSELIPSVMPVKSSSLSSPSSPPTSSKERMFTYQIRGSSTQEERTYYVRLLTYFKGSVLAEVPHFKRTNKLLNSVGRMLGRCDRVLSRASDSSVESTSLLFPAKYVKVASRRNHFWDLRNAIKLKNLTIYVKNNENRLLLQRAFRLFDSKANHLLRSSTNVALRSQVTHNDGNDHNIIVKLNKNTNTYSLVGLIDFGDIVYTKLICNLAITISYCCCNTNIKKNNMTEQLNYAICTASSIVEGYHNEMPLTKEELDILWWCMIGRICHSLASSSRRQILEPSNKYIVVSEQPFWQLLKTLSHPSFEINAEKARKSFREVTQL